MTHLTFDPYVPWVLWVPMALVAAALLGWYAVAARGRLAGRRRWGVPALMTLAMVVPLGILLNPTWLEQVPPPAGKPLLTILVDRSASMATADADDGSTRCQSACRIAAEVARRLEDRYEVRLRTLSETSSPVALGELDGLVPDGPATDLAAGIEESLDTSRPQGQAMLLLSDGVHNAAGGSARLRETLAKARAMAAPVYTKALGGRGGVEDVELSLDRPQEVAFVGQRIPVVVRLRQRGSAGQQVGLAMALGGETVERRDARLAAEGKTEETFEVVQDKPGLYRYELRAEPLPGEVTEVNNSATLLLRVVDEPIRVLLLEGKPYWDTKFLVRTLAEDRSIELTSIVRLAEGRLLERRITRPAPAGTGAPADETSAGGATTAATSSAAEATAGAAAAGSAREPAAPPRNDQWTIRTDAAEVLADPAVLDGYQVVVLGRDAEVFLTDASLVRLRKWLSSGDGSLVCFRGAPAAQIGQRLGELMPVRWTPTGELRFRVEWTAEGEALRWLPGGESDDLASLPSLARVSEPGAQTTLARVLAVASGPGGQVPVISYQPVGGGCVVVVEGAGMWRWAFLPAQYQQHDEVYGVLWRSLVRWLVANVALLPSQRLALRTDTVTFSTAQAAAATLLMRESELDRPVPEVQLEGGPLDSPRTFTPVPRGSAGQFHVSFGRLPEGRYWARVVGAGEDDVSAVAAFDVRGNLKERLDVAAESDRLRLIAGTSGGELLDRVTPELLAEKFDRQLSRNRPARTVQTTAWDRWWVLLGGFAVWAAAWGLRRWSGLV